MWGLGFKGLRLRVKGLGKYLGFHMKGPLYVPLFYVQSARGLGSLATLNPEP